MARILSTWIDGFIGSAKVTGEKAKNSFGKLIPQMKEYFASGFSGKGWKIYNSSEEPDEPKFTMEIDNLRVRENLVAQELVISKIRAVCGALGISQACGKVKSVTSTSTTYTLEMEGDDEHGYGGFQAHDLIRCQRWLSNGVHGYWVEIASVDGKYITVNRDEFDNSIYISSDGNNLDKVNSRYALTDGTNTLTDGTNDLAVGYYDDNTLLMVAPLEGDELVQYGNTTDTARQTAIYIHADGVGKPAIDILEGIESKNFNGCLKCRLGGELPDGGGFGLYMYNGRIVSSYDNGDTHYYFEPNGDFALGFNNDIEYDHKTGVITIGEWVKFKWKANAIVKVSYAVARDRQEGEDPSTLYYEDEIPQHEQTEFVWTKTEFADGTVSYVSSYEGADFVKEWQGTATEISSRAVVSPNLFVGSKTNGKYTGVFISNDLKDISTGKAISGIYGVDNSESRFVLDPVRENYKFYGDIFCDQGQINGLHVGLSLNSVNTITADDWTADHTNNPTKPLYLRESSGYYVINYYVAGQVFYLAGAPSGAFTLELPPYKTADTDNSDYTLGLQLLGRTFYFINKTGRAISINCNHLNSSGVFIEGGLVTLPIGGTLTAKCCLYTDGRVYWDVITGTAQSITPTKPLKPSDNPYNKTDIIL